MPPFCRLLGLSELAHVKYEFVVDELESVLLGDLSLQRLDPFVDELDDLAAVHVHHVVVMLVSGQLVYRVAVIEVVAGDDAGRLELGQHPVDGGQAHRIVRIDQALVDVFGAQVVRLGALQNLQHLQARQRDLEAGSFDVGSGQRFPPLVVGDTSPCGADRPPAAAGMVTAGLQSRPGSGQKNPEDGGVADLKGRVAVVTGASRGVGRGVAEGLAEAGATVYVTGRSESSSNPPEERTIQATAASVDSLGGRGIAVRVDHNDDAEVKALFDRIRAEQGRLDVLVNNVYKIPDPPVFSGGFWEHPVSVWDDQCGVGLRGYYVASVFAAPMMVAQRSGLIVNISSRGGDQYVFSTSYGVGKAGVDRMARDMAHELRGYHVAALSLRPSSVKTEFILDAVASGAVKLDMTRAQSPRFTGRCVAALAMDPDVMEKSGGVFMVADLAEEYRFTDPDRVDAS